MARKIKPDIAAKSISDALALSHFVVANFLVVIGEFTNLFDFVLSKHPGMDFVKQYISTPGMLLAGPWLNDANTMNLWLSMESVIILASLIYWALCWLATRFLFIILE